MLLNELTLPCTVLTLSDTPKDEEHHSKHGWVRWAEHDFAEIIYIISKRTFANACGGFMIKFFDGNTIQEQYIPQDTEFEPIDSNLADGYISYYLKHLSLNYDGLIGSDPEIFATENKQIIPAFNFLGSKQDKKPVGERNHVYWDGFQAEFDTTANACLAFHCDSVHDGLWLLNNKLKAFNKNAVLDIRPTLDIPKEMLENANNEHVEFGCMPSYNVYGMEGIKESGRNVGFRSAGGHIHFGIGQQTHESVIPLVKALDSILGVACVSLFASFDEPRRRTMYGLAGEYRLPKHGMEYRTLSNAWLMHPALMHIVFDVARQVLAFGRDGLLSAWDASEEEVIHCINTCNVKLAREILKRNHDVFFAIIKTKYNTKMTQACIKLFLNGAESAFNDLSNIEKNWHLNDVWSGHSNSPNVQFQSVYEAINNDRKVG